VVGRMTKIEMYFFIALEGGSRAVQKRWPAVVVRIQCFDFDSRGEAMGQSIARR
jgi:hypothetical protein